MIDIPDGLLEKEGPFFVCSRGVLDRQVESLARTGAEVFYSVKTNPEKGIIGHLNARDVGFSLSDRSHLSLLDPMPVSEKTLYYQRALTRERARRLIDAGIRSFIVDSRTAFENASREGGEDVAIIIRIKPGRVTSNDYSGLYVPGIGREDLPSLLSAHPGPTGILHHTTSQIEDLQSWTDKFDEIEEFVSRQSVDIINLGGGIPIDYSGRTDYGGLIDTVSAGVERLEPYCDRLIIEPGRFIVGPACSLVTKVDLIDGDRAVLNASLYSAHIDSIIAGISLPHRVLHPVSLSETKSYRLLGSSLCNLDVFSHAASLPRLSDGDVVVFDNAGAYNFSSDFTASGSIKTYMVD